VLGEKFESVATAGATGTGATGAIGGVDAGVAAGVDLPIPTDACSEGLVPSKFAAVSPN
jgi:hypothetical protein